MRFLVVHYSSDKLKSADTFRCERDSKTVIKQLYKTNAVSL